uniref:TTF-type domain-containing protein n=1 Tax=Schizaphis graminum TaxID=13262 RepID=A0A2S2NU68_SCHGA
MTKLTTKTLSKQRVFDIFNFTKPQPDKLTSINKPKLKCNSDNDSDSVDSKLLALSSFSRSTLCLNKTDYKSTSYKNLLKNDENIDLGDLQSGPIRPVLKSYPMTKFGNQKRCFNASYFNEHDWLEYSIQNDALYCFPCRNFGANDNEETFSKTGFRNWKKWV